MAVGIDKYGNTFNIGGVSAPYMGGVSDPLENTYDPGYISSLIRAGETPSGFAPPSWMSMRGWPG